MGFNVAQKPRVARLFVAQESGAPCEFCSFTFDQERLGRYGCPNCNGEGLEERAQKKGRPGKGPAGRRKPAR